MASGTSARNFPAGLTASAGRTHRLFFGGDECARGKRNTVCSQKLLPLMLVKGLLPGGKGGYHLPEPIKRTRQTAGTHGNLPRHGTKSLLPLLHAPVRNGLKDVEDFRQPEPAVSIDIGIVENRRRSA